MPQDSQKQMTSDRTGSRKRRAFRVLVIDREPQFVKLLAKCQNGDDPMEVFHVRTISEARKRLAKGAVDLAVIEPELPDGSGLELAEELKRGRKHIKTIMVSEKPSLEAAVQAIRAGAADFMVKPLDLQQVSQRVREVVKAQQRDKEQTQRIRRLRRACKKLNQARVDVSRQVDILCNDLVTAYQELAGQVQQVVSARDFEAVIEGELDLEALLRKTLSYLVEQAGPTNAAVFLPATADEFSVGGYVNYDCSSSSADMLLQHLADVAAPRFADQCDVVHLTDDEALTHWLGDDALYLSDCDMIAFACQHEDEALAVITLFRDRSQPFSNAAIEACSSVAATLGQTLVKLIRVHHRHLGEDPFAG